MLCDISVEALVPRGAGVELAPLVEKTRRCSPTSQVVDALRRPLLRLPESDAALLENALHQLDLTSGDAARSMRPAGGGVPPLTASS